MRYPVDDPKLERLRRLMAEEALDALVLRAPDDVVYVSSFWPMKGHELAVFPREGEQALVVLEPQREDAERSSWAARVETIPFYDERDPRPPGVRASDVCVRLLRELGVGRRVGLELSHGTQASDRMAGEPGVVTHAFVEGLATAAGEVVDASPLLARARMVKSEQEIERMRLANELADSALEHVRELLRPGMRTSEVAAAFEAHVHATGVGYRGKVDAARGFAVAWSGGSIAPFTATPDWRVEDGAPTLLEVWVCADGYWCDLGKNLVPGSLSREYERLFDVLVAVFDEAADFLRDGAPLGELDRIVRARLAEAGYPGQPPHPLAHGVGARAHEPPFAHQARPGGVRNGMVLALEPGIFWEGGGGARLEDNFLVTEEGPEKLCRFPDDPRTALALEVTTKEDDADE